jgi:acetyl-CoA acetyltransferase
MAELRHAYICDAVRTPIGRFGGGLAYMRTDDLAAVPIMALMARNTDADWGALDEVILGCANQAWGGQSQRRAHGGIAFGTAGEVPGATINRLCASGWMR